MVGLINHDEIESIRPAMQPAGKRLNRSNLNREVGPLRFAGGNHTHLKAQGLQAFHGLADQFLAMHKDDHAAAFGHGRLSHIREDNSFAATCGKAEQNGAAPLGVSVPDPVHCVLLIIPQDHSHFIFSLT